MHAAQFSGLCVEVGLVVGEGEHARGFVVEMQDNLYEQFVGECTEGTRMGCYHFPGRSRNCASCRPKYLVLNRQRPCLSALDESVDEDHDNDKSYPIENVNGTSMDVLESQNDFRSRPRHGKRGEIHTEDGVVLGCEERSKSGELIYTPYNEE